jgi:hypothetical protein
MTNPKMTTKKEDKVEGGEGEEKERGKRAIIHEKKI